MTALHFVSKLEGVGKTASGWQARCPAHDDRNPSLSVTEDGGKILLHCHAGCSVDSICSAVGIAVSDLFPENPNRDRPAREIAAYDYTDAQGNLVFQVVRYDPKGFRQRRPDGKGGWIWNMRGVVRVLFQLPKVIKAIADERTLFIAEGERDVIALEAAGFAATCNPGGAGKWQAGYTEALRGADVIIIADKDKAGRDHAALVASNLHGAAKRVRVIELPDVGDKPVKDACDYLAAGGTAADLDDLAQSTPELESTLSTASLPSMIDASEFLARPLKQPAELVRGMLHKGSKLALGGGSKSFKTWTLLDLGLSVAYGKPWLSHETTPGKVLIVNFEIQEWSFQKRIAAVAEAREIAIEPGHLFLWNLRGKAANFNLLLPQLRDLAKQDFSLIILDPVYKLYGQTDENKAGDVAMLMNAIEDLAVSTGAAVAFGAHFSKGNQAAKESIDRISGSGVFARDPDSILIFTKHETADAFTVEPTLRNFAPIEPFVVRWQFPLMQRDGNLDPSKLKKVGGRQKEHTPEALLDVLDSQSMTTRDWLVTAKTESGMSDRTFYSLKAELQKQKRVILSAVTKQWQRVNKR